MTQTMIQEKKKTTTVKKTKRKIPELAYHVQRLSDYQAITDNRQTHIFIYLNLIQAIKEGIEKNADVVPLVKLKGTRASLLLPRASWKKSLKRAIYFLADLEMYESCQRCKDLVDQL